MCTYLLYCTVQYSMVQYNTHTFKIICTCTLQCKLTSYHTILYYACSTEYTTYSIVQDSTGQYGTVQHSTIQHRLSVLSRIGGANNEYINMIYLQSLVH